MSVQPINIKLIAEQVFDQLHFLSSQSFVKNYHGIENNQPMIKKCSSKILEKCWNETK
jgi:hypothetical protein